ncbi:lamin tail domain-containing protein [Flavobacterium microcysteis]
MKTTLRLQFSKALIIVMLGFFNVGYAQYYPMNGGNYSQDFADIANWSNNFASGVGASNWSAVAINSSGTIPDGKKTTKASATFTTTTSGGIQRGSGTLLFLSTGSAANGEAVAVDLLLDFSGSNAGTLSFDWVAVDNGSGTRPTSLRVYYSLDNVSFTELTDAQILEKTSASSGSITNIQLPAALNNAATARLRFYNHAGSATGGGNRDKISIDNLLVTSTSSSLPAVLTSVTELTDFGSVNVGSVSGNGSFTVSGTNLIADINVAAPSANFQLSLDGTSGWGSSVAIPFGSGTVTNVPVYARFSPQSSGLKSGSITVNSNTATQKTVSVSGTGVFPSPVATSATLVGSNGFTANWSNVSIAASYALDVYSIVTGPPATDLFISEYVEGSSNNKAIEIYNGTGAPVDLSNYSLRKQSNGSGSYVGNLALSGTLNNGETYIIAHSSSTASILAVADITLSNAPMDFNGNDAVGLFKNGTQIDEVGVFNQTSNWGIDVTLRRKSSILSPVTPYSTANWDSYPTDTFDGLGSHAFDSAATVVYAIQNQNVGNVTSYPVSGLAQGTTYHYVVRAISGSDISPNSNSIDVTTTSTITTWNGAAWSNGTPTVSLDAIIAGNYSTGAAAPQGAFTAKSLTVSSGILTVASGTSLTVENAIANNAGANNFIVESGANLIQTNAVANTGSIKVKRNSNPLYRFDYTLWSSPVIGQNLKAFSSATLSNRFYTYNTATGTNGDYEAIFPTQNEGTYSFEAGKGYLIRTPDSHPAYVEGNPGTAINAEFAGVPYNQSVNVALSNANTGFNLVGNPYPSAISIAQLFSSNTDAIDGTIWFWRKRHGASGSGYATSTGMGVTSAQPEAAALNPNGVISAGQGFLVKVKSGATQNTLNFSNALRSATTGGAFFRNSNTNEVERHRIWLNLSNETEIVGQTLLGYMTGATSGVDYGIEGSYFNDSPIAFTSYIENKEFAIQGRSLPFTSDDVVPMSFKTDVAGNYTIAIDRVDGLFAGSQDVLLKDNVTAQIHDLKSGAYSFASAAGVFNNRFEVVYRAALGVKVPAISSKNIVVYKQNGSLVINSGNYIMENIELYDMSGRLIYTKNNVDTSSAIIANLPVANQVLVVKITTAENGTANKKIVY